VTGLLDTVLGGQPTTIEPVGSKIRSYPEVAVRNSVGTRRVVAVTDTDAEAEELAAAMEGDYKSLDIHEWSKHYKVPLSFINEVAT
jgi:hypothetical protein